MVDQSELGISEPSREERTGDPSAEELYYELRHYADELRKLAEAGEKGYKLHKDRTKPTTIHIYKSGTKPGYTETKDYLVCTITDTSSNLDNPHYDARFYSEYTLGPNSSGAKHRYIDITSEAPNRTFQDDAVIPAITANVGRGIGSYRNSRFHLSEIVRLWRNVHPDSPFDRIRQDVPKTAQEPSSNPPRTTPPAR